MDNFVWPIITGILSPLLLFLLGGLLLKINWISSFVSKIYKTVYDGLRLNNDDAVSNGETIGKSGGEKEYMLYDTDLSDVENSVQKTSKNYGRDKGWSIRTFYTIDKQKLLDANVINFKVKGHADINIGLKKSELMKKFNLNDEHEDYSDGAGRIRIYINQNKDDNQFYLVRFGKRAFESPILLKKKY